ncbi:MAG: aspartate ammonia-lyase [SAR86 cluster bacterium BACL1 MAG-120920-bin57]|uniref:Fumarate hydratase class II n=2 Tax=SAR86 cluster TaxID=62672 RepID=A0A0R2U4E5_9GAMM|nr:MAG: aspartate ammonia-lyase [SAR86 cluster bacterium BACL1 MAG-120920-bin57]KRO94348.1 MAG: aspartate ammonia-lyase [SAR86 cluster bacterium BACL1 MAG-120820-bin45]KRP00728.1 MAG: aspartate ammonia-lyase [SAR86 cluster bacterium BACL1 MAG-120619-bin26]MDA0759951.1 class II fumarate hydratase [Pseudomonadota bacterium]
MKYRIEKDSMGEVKVPEGALWGAQTQRALENFNISGIRFAFPFGRSFIQALGIIKFSAATANQKLQLLDAKKASAIKLASKEVAAGQHDDHFPLDIFQTGSGTSTNMNANEVIATIASKKARIKINPNDHVNMSQSSNDVIPTAICISSMLDTERSLLPALEHLIKTIDKKGSSLKGKVKTGRTHLMDAMPIDFSQELSGWSAQLKAVKKSIQAAVKEMSYLPQGGTAIGTGINAHKDFGRIFAVEVKKLSKLDVKTSSNYFKSLSSQDAAAQLSSSVKNLSLVLTKISNDLRWMNSGPLTGLGEIELEALQPGSSIMPGKVNPVVPEAVAMACADVVGNDVTVSIASQSGNFQLNVMLPVIAYNLLKSITLMANVMPLLANKAIKTFKVNEANISESLGKNPILVTALNREIGYDKAAKIAKKAYKENRAIIDVAHEETGISISQLKALLDPAKLTKGGL